MGDFLDFLLAAMLVESFHEEKTAREAPDNYTWGDVEDLDDEDLDEFNEYENERYYDDF